jgi:arsenate reductase
MAEGWARVLRGEEIEPYSAGVASHGLDPHAVKVMAEVGVDISQSRSKLVQELSGITFDYVVTVCDRARESCPVFQGPARIVHQGFDDPPALARRASSEEEVLAHYRRVRDEIKDFVARLPDAFGKGEE